MILGLRGAALERSGRAYRNVRDEAVRIPVAGARGLDDEELNRGYLISPGLGEHMRCLDEPSVPLAIRLRCLRSCESLFCKLLLPHCSPHLSHRDEPGRSPLNAVCYMWHRPGCKPPGFHTAALHGASTTASSMTGMVAEVSISRTRTVMYLNL